MQILFFIPAFLGVIVTNILWYWIKEELRKNGFKVHYFHHHLNDLTNFPILIKRTEDIERRVSYIRIKRSLYISMFVTFICFVGGVIFMILSFGSLPN
ncbi:hypothetical protein [Ekhidna sp.]|uniref:hypothetical protein n=1 Tax=Ekhidna sp. TaxID=2608089 RepID=UPI0032F091AA